MSATKIEVLGTGCPKCRALEQTVREAVEELGMEAEITKVSAIEDIVARGVMMTPALAIDGEIRSSGRVLSPHDVRELLSGKE